MGRDPIGENGCTIIISDKDLKSIFQLKRESLLYGFLLNFPINDLDILGLLGMWPTFAPPGAGPRDRTSGSNNLQEGGPPCSSGMCSKTACRICVAEMALDGAYVYSYFPEPWKRNANPVVGALNLGRLASCNSCQNP